MNNQRRIPRLLVKALASGVVLVAAALPLAIASAAGAATFTPTGVAFTPHGGATDTIGTGASGTFTITGTGFAADGSTTTVTSTAPGLTFSGVSETNATTVTGSFASTTATVPGTYSLTVTDDTGPTTVAGAVVVEANSAITSIAPASITQGNPPVPTTVVLTGTGFVSGATVTFTNDTDGTKLASVNSATGVFTAGVVTTGTQGSATETGGTSLSVKVDPTNSITGAEEAAGTYTVTVVNPDGGTTVDASAFTVLPYGVTSLTPSAVVPTAISTNTAVTIAGAGFEPGATVTLTGCSEASVSASSVASATQINATVTEVGTATQLCGITVTNPNAGAGGNGASYALAGALGVGESSTVAPTITATNATTPLVVGAASTTVTLTGTGLSQYSSAAAYVGTSAVAGGVTLSNPSGNTGTAVTFNVSAATGATAGPFNVVVSNGGAASNAFPAAVSVGGPVITSQTPAGLAVGAPVGTVITLTGTGFTNTTTGVVSGDLSGSIVSYSSATTMTMVLTASPGAGDVAAPPTITLHQVPATGGTVVSPAFTMKIDAAPTISGLTYAVGTDVGVGAVAQTVTIHGSGFQTGVKVGSFVNGNGTADPDVTATVTSINTAGTAITATIAIAAGDTNLADGYSVTNPDGGVAKVGVSLTALLIGAGPTITSVTPASGSAGATTSFAVVGTGFQSGAVVSLSPANGTCGTATITASTTLAATCTLGQPSSVPTDLVVTNVDGGSATFATPVLPAASTKTAPTFHVSGVHGAAVAGKTVTITISGTGFYGQPKITSTAVGSKFAVAKDNGRLLTVHATIKAGTKAGEHVLTVKLANGKSGKAGFNIKA